MGLAAFNMARRKAAEKAERKKKMEFFVKDCEAKGLDPQLMTWSKDELVNYASTYGVTLDKRKSLENMVREVMKLDEGG
jgi:hypothetical protein